MYANVRNLDPLVGGVVANHHLAPLLDARFALHFDSNKEFFPPGTVVFKLIAGMNLLYDERFLRVIEGFRGLLRGLTFRLLGNSTNRYQEEHGK